MSIVQSELESLIKKTVTLKQESIVAEAQKWQEAIFSPNNPGSEGGDVKKSESDQPLPEKSSLENIIEAKQQVSQVKASLGSIIDTMAQNPSIFNRAATYYGELPFWQKIALGLGISVPTLAVGIFAEIGVLLVVGGVTAVAYTATGIVLDDHHHCNINIADRLKKGIVSLADVLELTINALDKIGQKLAEEVEKFKKENDKLASNVLRLTDEVGALSSQVELFIEIEKMLRQDKKDLEEVAESLQQSATDQSALLQNNQEELARVTKEYDKSQKQLAEKVLELQTVKAEMSQEVEKVHQLSNTLTTTVNTFSKLVSTDQKEKEFLHYRLKAFLGDQEKSLGSVVASLNTTEESMERGRDEFMLANNRYNYLLERQEELVARLEMLDKKLHQEEASKQATTKVSKSELSAPELSSDEGSIAQVSMSQLLSTKGMYAIKQREQPASVENVRPTKQAR